LQVIWITIFKNYNFKYLNSDIIWELFFLEIVEILYHEKIPEFQKMPTDKFLPRIKYKNGKIQLLNEDNNVIVTDNESSNTDDNDDDDSDSNT